MSTLEEDCTGIICKDDSDATEQHILRFEDTVILQEDFLQFGKVIDSFQVFYGVVISLQDLKTKTF